MGKSTNETTATTASAKEANAYDGMELKYVKDSNDLYNVVNSAKKRGRPELKYPDTWWKHKYCLNKDVVDVKQIKHRDSFERINYKDVSLKEFVEKYESKNIPVMIKHSTDAWDREFWNIDNLVERFGNILFKCGEDDEGYSVKMKLKYFAEYMRHQNDDSPMYVFDGSIESDKDKQIMMKNFSVPKYFREDWFGLVGERRRPPYRWFVLGPIRSGSNMHIDPLGTGAWNTLISGYKRWVLLPPHVKKDFAKPDIKGYSTEAIEWFTLAYPIVLEKAKATGIKVTEILQRPGETIYVPPGWWHVVINVTNTCAVTQNFCSSTNFPIVWKKTVKGRPKMSQKWERVIKQEHKSLYEKLKSVNLDDDDGFESDSSSDDSTSSSSSSSSSSSGSDDEGIKKKPKFVSTTTTTYTTITTVTSYDDEERANKSKILHEKAHSRAINSQSASTDKNNSLVSTTSLTNNVSTEFFGQNPTAAHLKDKKPQKQQKKEKQQQLEGISKTTADLNSNLQVVNAAGAPKLDMRRKPVSKNRKRKTSKKSSSVSAKKKKKNSNH